MYIVPFKRKRAMTEAHPGRVGAGWRL